LNAIEECLEEATISLSCISEKLNKNDIGIGKMRLRERLAKLENDGKISSKKVGTGLGYRPRQKITYRSSH
jgi:DNA-binding Lrp family transcriptional regulator